MQMWMKMQVLTPGVQHVEEADGGAEMFGIGGNGQQSFGSGLKQDAVNPSRILNRQAADLLRQSEHDVEIGNGQQLRLPLGKPLGASGGLALRTVPVAARVI
jgi:hypothetical protein